MHNYVSMRRYVQLQFLINFEMRKLTCSGTHSAGSFNQSTNVDERPSEATKVNVEMLLTAECDSFKDSSSNQSEDWMGLGRILILDRSDASPLPPKEQAMTTMPALPPDTTFSGSISFQISVL